jgi:adenine-specific DNA-methyltransferase
MTKPATPAYVTKTTPAITQAQIERLKQLFPECVSEGQVDFDRLRATLGDADALAGDDAYTFTWAGKQEAFRAIQTPSGASLAPAPDESVHWDATQHLFIEGENLEVLKLLYKSYFGKVKMIYIDPPYNTGNDFIYRDDYSEPRRAYLEKTGQMDAEGNVLTSNPEASGRYHSDWLTMMYPRLFLARQLLREDGVIFVSIDDHEVHNLRLMLNEIFGEENFFTTIVVRSNKRGQTYKQISKTHEYVLVYTKSPDVEINELPKRGKRDDLNFVDEIGHFNVRELRNRNPKFGRFNRPNLFYPMYVDPNTVDQDGFSPVALEKHQGFQIEVLPLNSSGEESCWRWGRDLVRENIDSTTLTSNVVARQKRSGAYGIYEKYRKTTYKAKSIWLEKGVITEKGTIEMGALGLSDYFDFPKPQYLVRKLLMLGTEAGDTVIDFFAGSCTTAQAVLALNREDKGNRRFIMVQFPELTPPDSLAHRDGFESIADIGKERIRRVIASMQDEDKDGQIALDLHPDEGGPQNVEDLGFKVFKLAPSTFHQWEPPEDKEARELRDQLSLFDRGLKENADPCHVIYEVILKLGYSLNSSIKPLDLASNRVFKVTDSGRGSQETGGNPPHFYICLDDAVATATLDALPLERMTTFVCLDTALDDSQKVNLAMQCLLKVI